MDIDALKAQLDKLKKRGKKPKAAAKLEEAFAELAAEPEVEEEKQEVTTGFSEPSTVEVTDETAPAPTPAVTDEAEPELDVESLAIEEQVVEAHKEQAEDRSAYNCAHCRGEGMTFDPPYPEGLVCPVCRGTGKVR